MDEFNKKKYAWNTKVRAGRPWNDLDSAQEATRNAQAAFRDGRYKVTAVAFDYQANDSVPKDIEIIVDNFTQNVQTLVFYTPGQPIPIFGGDHYLGNDNPKLYAIPKIGNLNYIPNMTELPQSSFVKELRTDGVGSINPDLITMSQYPSTEFWFVVDYDDE